METIILLLHWWYTKENQIIDDIEDLVSRQIIRVVNARQGLIEQFDD
jgi:hypothetical protein